MVYWEEFQAPQTPPCSPEKQLVPRIMGQSLGAAVALDFGRREMGPPRPQPRAPASQGPLASWKVTDFWPAQLSPPFWLWVFAPLHSLWARFWSRTPCWVPGAGHLETEGGCTEGRCLEFALSPAGVTFHKNESGRTGFLHWGAQVLFTPDPLAVPMESEIP